MKFNLVKSLRKDDALGAFFTVPVSKIFAVSGHVSEGVRIRSYK